MDRANVSRAAEGVIECARTECTDTRLLQQTDQILHCHESRLLCHVESKQPEILLALIGIGALIYQLVKVGSRNPAVEELAEQTRDVLGGGGLGNTAGVGG